MSSILVVCTGNICRSPVGEAVLKSQLPEEVTVTSAGTHAPEGRPAAPETYAFVARELSTELEHVAQQLTKQHAEASDLIITMTTGHRAWVARTAPRAVRRTFTLREIELIVAQLQESTPPLPLRELAMSASNLRARIRSKNDNNMDIADPFGGTPQEYEDSFQQVLRSSLRLGTTLRSLSSLP